MQSEPPETVPVPSEPAGATEPRTQPPKRPAPVQTGIAPPAPPPSASFGEIERPAGLPAAPQVKQRVGREAPSRVAPPSVRELIPPPGPNPAARKAVAQEAVAVLPPASSASVATWERAAKALEARDWRGADQALDDLDSNGDAHTRDAAALARAQLWITQGRGAEARATLERLAERGHTPLIRRRAAALLKEL
jgi:hypothetical protein